MKKTLHFHMHDITQNWNRPFLFQNPRETSFVWEGNFNVPIHLNDVLREDAYFLFTFALQDGGSKCTPSDAYECADEVSLHTVHFPLLFLVHKFICTRDSTGIQ